VSSLNKTAEPMGYVFCEASFELSQLGLWCKDHKRKLQSAGYV